MTITMNQAVQNYLSQGYVMVGSYGNTVQLRKPKGSPSCMLVAILLLLGILPGILYLIWHNATPEQTLTLTADENGNFVEPTIMPGTPMSKNAKIAIAVIVILVILACISWTLVSVLRGSGGSAPIGMLVVGLV